MKIHVQKESLTHGLARLLKILPAKGMKAFQAVWLRPGESSLTFGAQTGDMSMAFKSPADCREGEALGIEDGIKFCRVISKLQAGDMVLELVNNRMIVRQSRSRFTFDLIDPSWAMKFPGAGNGSVQVDGPAISECLKFVRTSVAPDAAVDGVLGCAYVHPGDDTLAVVGFNSVQASIIYHNRTGLDGLGRPLLIANRYLGILGGILGDGAFVCQVIDGRLVLSAADMSLGLSIPLEDQEDFPDYKLILSSVVPSATLLFDRQELLQSLDRLDVFSTMESTAFRVTGREGGVRLSLDSTMGDGEEDIDMDVDGDFEPVLFNLSSFAGLVGSMPGDGRVALMVGSPERPCIMSPEEARDSVMSVVMPVVREESYESYQEDQGGDIEQ